MFGAQYAKGRPSTNGGSLNRSWRPSNALCEELRLLT
jgi:hypothetical protein